MFLNCSICKCYLINIQSCTIRQHNIAQHQQTQHENLKTNIPDVVTTMESSSINASTNENTSTSSVSDSQLALDQEKINPDKEYSKITTVHLPKSTDLDNPVSQLYHILSHRMPPAFTFRDMKAVGDHGSNSLLFGAQVLADGRMFQVPVVFPSHKLAKQAVASLALLHLGRELLPMEENGSAKKEAQTRSKSRCGMNHPENSIISFPLTADCENFIEKLIVYADKQRLEHPMIVASNKINRFGGFIARCFFDGREFYTEHAYPNKKIARRAAAAHAFHYATTSAPSTSYVEETILNSISQAISEFKDDANDSVDYCLELENFAKQRYFLAPVYIVTSHQEDSFDAKCCFIDLSFNPYLSRLTKTEAKQAVARFVWHYLISVQRIYCDNNLKFESLALWNFPVCDHPAFVIQQNYFMNENYADKVVHYCSKIHSDLPMVKYIGPIDKHSNDGFQVEYTVFGKTYSTKNIYLSKTLAVQAASKLAWYDLNPEQPSFRTLLAKYNEAD